MLFPFMGQQFYELLMSGLLHVWHSCNDVTKIFTRIHSMIPASRQKRYDNTHILCCIMVATEKIVFPS